MTWTAPDMSDRISIDELYIVTNQGLRLGHCVLHPLKDRWGFRLDSDARPADHSLYRYREVCAPYVVKFIDDQITVLNITLRLTS